LGDGVTPETAIPLEWDAQKNVAWKVALPDRGNSTPIIWGNKVFITQAIEARGERQVWCLSATDGSVLWKSNVVYKTPEETHDTNPYCSASPATDGNIVVACLGAAGLFAYDMNGKTVWNNDLGKQDYEWGNGSSPVIHGDFVFIYWGPSDTAALIAFDKKTGKEVWRFKDPTIDPGERTDGFRGNKDGRICTYSTPVIARNAQGRDELLMSYPRFIRAFDPATGKPLWTADGLNPLVYTSPVARDGVVVAMGGYFGNSIGVRTGGTGEVTATHRLWQQVRTKNRLGSPVIHNGLVFVFNTDGAAECIDLQTGKTVWLERLRGKGAKNEVWASLVASGDRIYALNQSGDCIVFRADTKPEVLAVNAIGAELTNASPAVADGAIYLRTHKHLWKIAESTATAP
jgi:outer membrane protein assembly factor BamB